MSKQPPNRYEHVPVLADEVFEWLTPALTDGGVLVDCTLGGGGHAERFLIANPSIRGLGIDRDSDALSAALERLANFSDRVRFVHANFADIDDIVDKEIGGKVQAVIYDLGVSSFQLDSPERGFRYGDDSDLDMRMDASAPVRAADIVNGYLEGDLARVIASYGEERFARRIARAIVRRRKSEPFESAGDLAEVVKTAIPAATRRTGPHPARRTFQAIRIEVNDELESLQRSLPGALESLSEGGRIAAISYHSLEDRIVKRFFVGAAKGCDCPRDLPICVCGKQAEMRVLTRKVVRPSDAEVESNPRSDSARLRVAEKLGKAA